MNLRFIPILAYAVVTFGAYGETVIHLPRETNTISVAANEAIVLDYFVTATNWVRTILRQGETSHGVLLAKGGAVVGPCELEIFDVGDYPFSSAVITFHRFLATALKSV